MVRVVPQTAALLPIVQQLSTLLCMALTRTQSNLLLWLGFALMLIALLMRMWKTPYEHMENLTIGLLGLTVGVGVLALTIAIQRIASKLNEIRDLLREMRDDFRHSITSPSRPGL